MGNKRLSRLFVDTLGFCWRQIGLHHHGGVHTSIGAVPYFVVECLEGCLLPTLAIWIQLGLICFKRPFISSLWFYTLNCLCGYSSLSSYFLFPIDRDTTSLTRVALRCCLKGLRGKEVIALHLDKIGIGGRLTANGRFYYLVCLAGWLLTHTPCHYGLVIRLVSELLFCAELSIRWYFWHLLWVLGWDGRCLCFGLCRLGSYLLCNLNWLFNNESVWLCLEIRTL